MRFFKKREIIELKSKIEKDKSETKQVENNIKRKSFFMRVLDAIYGSIPYSYAEKIQEQVKYSGFYDDQRTFIASLLLSFFVLAIVTSFISYYIIGVWYWVLFIVVFILGIGALSPLFIFSLIADARRKNMEMLLPDMLMLTASNIKSGLTIDRALLFSARPEFGDLGKEIKKVAFEIYGGMDVSKALRKLTKRIKSDILEKTIDLLIEGLRSGGAVAKLLEETASDIKNTELLQKEIKGNVMMYTMFIFIAAVLGAPSLFAISNFLISSTMNMWGPDSGGFSDIDTSSSSLSFIKMSAPEIDIYAFNTFVIAALLITNLFASMIISLIQTGKIRGMVRYAPIFVFVSLIIYFSVKSLLLRVFGSMLGL